MPIKWTRPKKAEKRAEARRSDIGERANREARRSDMGERANREAGRSDMGKGANREARRSDASSEGKPAPKGKGKKEAK